MSKHIVLVISLALALGAAALVSTDAWAPEMGPCLDCGPGFERCFGGPKAPRGDRQVT